MTDYGTGPVTRAINRALAESECPFVQMSVRDADNTFREGARLFLDSMGRYTDPQALGALLGELRKRQTVVNRKLLYTRGEIQGGVWTLVAQHYEVWCDVVNRTRQARLNGNTQS